MSDARNISFNSFNLQTDHIFTEVIDDGGMPDRSLTVLPLAHANASKIPYDEWPSRTITIAGTIIGDSVADLDARLDTFKGALIGIDKNLDVDYGNFTRRYIATVKSFDAPRPGGLLYAEFSIEFICTRPFGLETSTWTLINTAQANLVLNPSFETDTSFWVANNGAVLSRVTTQHQDGAASMRIVTDGALFEGAFCNFTRPLNRGGTYTFSVYVNAPTGVPITVEIDTFINNDYQRTVTQILTGNGTFQRGTVTITLTNQETDVNLYVGTNSAATFYVDAAQFEQGATASAYPLATTRNGSSYTDTFGWLGTAPWQQPIVTVTLGTITAGGTGGTIQIGNNANGQAVVITRNWLAGDVLMVDSYNKIITVNGLEVDFTGAFPEFAPGIGAVGVAHNMTLVFTYKVSYQPQYL
jgi:hypothetical protein